MSDDFKKIAAREIEEFKAEYRARFPGRDAEDLTDEDLLREVMNTVGKAGKLGEHVNCVVSVSMLTEGWDANTVTHILGVRAFGTQLLCEQVVGRGLRRMSYAANEQGHVRAGVRRSLRRPVLVHPVQRLDQDPKPGPLPTRVRALESRIACEITFPRLLGYRYDAGRRAAHGHVSPTTRRLALSTADIPTKTENAPDRRRIAASTRLDDLKRRRPNEVAFLLAKLTLEKYFRDDDGNDKPWLFPQLLGIAKRWLAECVTLQGPHLPATAASDRVRPRRGRPDLQGHRRIDRRHGGAQADPPPYDTLGSTRYVDFDTTRPVYRHARRQVPHLARRRRYRFLGAEDGPDAGRHGRGRPLRQEPQPRLHHPVHLNGEEQQLHSRLHRLHRRRPRPERPVEPDHRSHRRKEEGQGRQGRHGPHALGAGGQQPRRLRPLGVHRNRRPVGRTKPHPRFLKQTQPESTKEVAHA